MEIDFKMILEAFLIESDENLQMMEETLLALEAQPDDAENLQAIFRCAHTIKGGAGTVGLTNLSEYAHVIEDLLDRLRKHTVEVTPDVISLLLESVDALRQIVPAAVAGNEEIQSAHAALLDRIANVASGKASLVEPQAEIVEAIENVAAKESETLNQKCVQEGEEEEISSEFRIGDFFITERRATLEQVEQALSLQRAGDPRRIGEILVEQGAVKPTDVVEALTKQKEARQHKAVNEINGNARTMRVDIDKLDRMMNLTGEIAIARGRLKQMLEKRKVQVGEDLIEANCDADRLYMEFQEQVMKLRMVPVGPSFRRYARTVRDVSVANGKQARLEIEGGDVEVDTAVIERLKDPLLHMIRNALDHGIEPLNVRTEKGKDPCGLLILRAFHYSDNIVIQLMDDGAGFNKEKILARASSRGMLIEPEKMTDSEIYRLVFEPGFSTADKVTNLSGRGVGMDVVLKNIDSIRGFVQIESQEGQGSVITIRLPLTLSIIDGFGVGVGDETYIIPLESVTECLTFQEDGPRRADGKGVMNLRNKAVPYVRLRNFFSMEGNMPDRENVVVVQQEGRHTGLVVDALYGESQAVIKPLSKLFQGLPGVSGSTILGNGRVALILDVRSLLHDAENAQAVT